MTATDKQYKPLLINRRRLLTLGALCCGGALVGAKNIFNGQSETAAHSPQHKQLFSSRNSLDGQHWCESYTLDGEAVFRTPVSQRAHDIVLHPSAERVLFVARRPGTKCYWLDSKNGKLLSTLHARNNRHFYGHGVFDPQGHYLYLTENDTRQPGRGVIGVYTLQNDQPVFVKELSSHGIGPHQILWSPAHNALIVANGGIRTEAESRKDMNLDAMESSLVIMDSNGTLISKDTLPEQQSSIRHLAVLNDGTIVSSQQFMGEMDNSSTLLAIKPPHEPLQAFPLSEEQHAVMRQYTASVAVNSTHGLIALSAPRGNRLMVWDISTKKNLLDIHVPDCAGVAATESGFIVSSGQTRCIELRYNHNTIEKIASHLPSGGWDNHLKIA